MAGVAVAAKALKPSIKIVGVQTANIPSMKHSFEKGVVTTAFNDVTLADGIAVKTPGNLTFNVIKDLVDEIIVIEEDEISQAILFLLEYQKAVLLTLQKEEIIDQFQLEECIRKLEYQYQ